MKEENVKYCKKIMKDGRKEKIQSIKRKGQIEIKNI